MEITIKFNPFFPIEEGSKESTAKETFSRKEVADICSRISQCIKGDFDADKLKSALEKFHKVDADLCEHILTVFDII